MTEIKIEIGENLANTVQAFVREVGKTTAKKGESIGAEVQKAFGIDVTKAANKKIMIDAALEHGSEISFTDD